MRIQVVALRQEKVATEVHRFEDLSVPPLHHEGAEILFPLPGRAKVTLHATRPGLVAHVDADLEGQLQCDRCLAPFPWQVHLDYHEEFLTPEEAAQSPAAPNQESRRTIYQGEFIELDEGLTENLILALPMKRLCQPACRGLCPRCGTDLNESTCGCSEEPDETRLAPLRALLEQMGQEE